MKFNFLSSFCLGLLVLGISVSAPQAAALKKPELLPTQASPSQLVYVSASAKKKEIDKFMKYRDSAQHQLDQAKKSGASEEEIRMLEYRMIKNHNQLVDLGAEKKKISVADYKVEEEMVSLQYANRKIAEAKKAGDKKAVKEWEDKKQKVEKRLDAAIEQRNAQSGNKSTSQKQTVSENKSISQKQTSSQSEAATQRELAKHEQWLKTINGLSKAEKERELAKYKRWLLSASTPSYVRALERKIAVLEEELGHSGNTKTVNTNTEKTDQYTKHQEEQKKFDEESKDLVNRVTGNNGQQSNSNQGTEPEFARTPLLCTSTNKCQVKVSNESQLKNALNSAKCGCDIVLGNGTYKGPFTMSKKCSAKNPLVVRAENPGKATISSTFSLSGSHTVLADLFFRNGNVIINGMHNRVTRNVFNPPSSRGIDVKNDYNRVDHNELTNFPGIAIRVSPGSNNRIDHNHIHHTARKSGNGGEAISVLGGSRMDKTRNIIEYNLLNTIDVPGEGEAISIKKSSNIVRYNTLLNSPISAITNRNGVDNLYEGNYMEGSRGLYIFGTGHHVIGNTVTNGSAIHIRAGNGYDGAGSKSCPQPASQLKIEGGRCVGMHAAARDVRVENNRAPIVVGDTYSIGGARTNNKAALNNVLINNGMTKPRLLLERGTKVKLGEPSGPRAKKLTPADVGPRAAGRSCQ